MGKIKVSVIGFRQPQAGPSEWTINLKDISTIRHIEGGYSVVTDSSYEGSALLQFTAATSDVNTLGDGWKIACSYALKDEELVLDKNLKWLVNPRFIESSRELAGGETSINVKGVDIPESRGLLLLSEK